MPGWDEFDGAVGADVTVCTVAFASAEWAGSGKEIGKKAGEEASDAARGAGWVSVRIR